MKQYLKDINYYLKSKKIYIFLICFSVSFVFLTICSANSFLYAVNEWIDQNWFITISRGMASGKIPYKDLYEQKGPVLFFMFLFVTLFKDYYLGAFFLELIFWTIYLFIGYEFSRKFLSRNLSFISILVLAFITGTSDFYYFGGGSVEEYCLPFFLWMIYKLYEFFEGKQFTKINSFCIGIVVSLIFWSKYNLIIFPAIILVIWLIKSIKEKDYKNLFLNILYMFIGFVVITAIVLICFACVGAIKDLFLSYFYDNIIRYKPRSGNIVGEILYFLIINILPTLFILIGILFIFLKYKRKGWVYFIIVFLYMLSFFIVGYMANYYFLPITIFIFISVLVVLDYCQKFLNNILKSKYTMIIFNSIVSILMIISTIIFSNNISEFGRKREEFVTYQVAEEIKSLNIETPTLFCYKMYDYGFYNALGVIPNEKYFANNNFSREYYPEMFDSFESAIIEQRNDFIVVKLNRYNQEQEFLEQYYTLYKVIKGVYIEYNRSSEFNVVIMYRNNLILS